MRTSAIMDVHFLGENIHRAFKQAKLDPHAAEGALSAAVACLAGNEPYYHKDLGVAMVGLPPNAPASITGSRYFNQLAHSEIVYDLSCRSPIVQPLHSQATNLFINGRGTHFIAFMLNDRFCADVDRVLDCIPPLTTEPVDTLRTLKRPTRLKSLKSDIIHL